MDFLEKAEGKSSNFAEKKFALAVGGTLNCPILTTGGYGAEIQYQGVTVLSNLGNGWGYEMTPAELAKKDEFYSIYWSEYNFVKESGSPELREMPDYLIRIDLLLKPEHKINIVRKKKMSIGVVPGGTFDFLSEVQNFMIRFIIETIMPIYRKGQVNGFTM